MNDNSKLSLLRSGKAPEVSYVYELYREEFISFVTKSFSVSSDEAIDIYQESFLALYRNVSAGKLTELSSSLKTYLFQIGKNQLFKQYRQKRGENLMETMDGSPDRVDEREDEEWMHKQEITNQVISSMEEPCHTVLTLFYWRQKSMKEIAEALNYKNDQVAKNRKGACLKKLKAVLQERFRKEGLV